MSNKEDIESYSSDSSSDSEEEEDIKEKTVVHKKSPKKENSKSKSISSSEHSTLSNTETNIVKASTATEIKANIVNGFYCCLYEGCGKKFKNASKFNRHGIISKKKKIFFYTNIVVMEHPLNIKMKILLKNKFPFFFLNNILFIPSKILIILNI